MVQKNNQLRNYWNRLQFKYKISAVNENTLEEIWKIRTSISSLLVFFIIIVFVIIVFTSVIIIATPIRYYLPGYIDSEIREQAVLSTIKIDSLQDQIRIDDAYLKNLKSVLSGDISIDDFLVKADTIAIKPKASSLQKSDREKEFVKEYQDSEQSNLSSLVTAQYDPIDGFVLVSPVNYASVTSSFNSNKGRYGVNLNLSLPATILSVTSGIVINTYDDIVTGYNIEIQHKNGLVSVYKGCTKLLYKRGDKIEAGDEIAVVSNNVKGKTKQNSVFEFELWYNGHPIDPLNYVSFGSQSDPKSLN